LVLTAALLFATALSAQNFAPPKDDIPPLAPPLPEIPPTFWEQHGLTVSGCIILLVALITGILWFALRPKPPVPIPPEVTAREQLTPLTSLPEDGDLLSRVSQALRHYLIAAFALPCSEPTTAEFCGVLTASKAIGPELATAVGAFMRVCDERKFSPAPDSTSLGAAGRALELVDLAEARRALLRQQTQASQQA